MKSETQHLMNWIVVSVKSDVNRYGKLEVGLRVNLGQTLKLISERSSKKSV